MLAPGQLQARGVWAQGCLLVAEDSNVFFLYPEAPPGENDCSLAANLSQPPTFGTLPYPALSSSWLLREAVAGVPLYP